MWKQSKRGFSVIEMMVVVVIIGILAQLGLSRYRVITAKSRQAEAKLNLNTIEELQETYFLEHGRYQQGNATGDKGTVGLGECSEEHLTNSLGFRPKDCEELRYKYNWTDSNTEATATSTTSDEDKFIYPGCDKQDEWTVTYDKGKITNTIKVIDKCK